MRQLPLRQCAWLLIIAFAVIGGVAHAETLKPGPDAPQWAHAGAALLLYLHIGGGAFGLVSGLTASLAEKGAVVHRAAGAVFLVSMFITYLIGAGVAPFLEQGQRPNFVAGILALYLLITGVMAARRGSFVAGTAERFGLAVALIITGMGALFMVMGANSESGTVDGSPPQAFLIFIIGGGVAALGEVNALIRRELSERARITRHLWRMCFSFFIASGSLFFGQPQLFPEWFNGSLLSAAVTFFPIFILVIWAVRVRFGHLDHESA